MDNIEIKPDSTCAIIVGIDRYPDWERTDASAKLHNSVREAREFARGLLEIGVAADRIRLFLSGNQDEDPLLDSQGYSVTPSDPDSIRNAIFEQPFEGLPDRNLLLFYWAGHGYTDNDHHQLLLDWKYSRSDRRIYDLDDLKRALRAETWRNFPKQLIIANVCATDHRGPFNRHEFNSLDLKNQLSRRQYTICSAAPGEPVPDGGRDGVSEFFKLLIGLLREKSERHSIIDLSDLTKEIIRKAVTLKHTPRIEWINFLGSRSIWDNDDRLAGLIRRHAAKCGVGLSKQKVLMQKCIHIEEEELERIRSTEEMIARLVGDRLSDDKRSHLTIYGPVLDFALRLEDEYNLDDLRREIDALFDGGDEKYEQSQLVDARNFLKEKKRLPKPPLFLSIARGKAGEGHIYFFLHDADRHKWVWEKRLETAELKSAFKEAIDAYEKIVAYCADDWHFQVFLPAEDLFEDIHEWRDPTRSADDEFLEANYKVSLRSYERAREVSGWALARKRWKTLGVNIKRREITGPPRINWIVPATGSVGSRVIDHHECVAFRAKPDAKIIICALEEGVPFMLWPRRNNHAWNLCCQKFGRLDAAAGLESIMDAFPRIRKETKDAGFAVFWDDPDHNVYEDRLPFEDMQ